MLFLTGTPIIHGPNKWHNYFSCRSAFASPKISPHFLDVQRTSRTTTTAKIMLILTTTNLPTRFGLLLMLASFWIRNVNSHGTQVRSCLTTAGKFRFFIEHWHGTISSVNELGTMDIRDDISGITSTSYPVGFVNNAVPGSLPDCVSPDVLARTCNDSVRNNWAFYESNERVNCGVTVQYTLISGNTVYLEEACDELYPLTVSATYTDTTSPTITVDGQACTGSQIVYYDKPSCDSFTPEVVNFNVVAIDDCDANPSLSLTQASGTIFPFGTTTVTATSTDDTGKTSTCAFNVQVRINPNCITPAPSTSLAPSESPRPSSTPSDSLQPTTSVNPSSQPTLSPSFRPSTNPSTSPSNTPSVSLQPSSSPSTNPTSQPSLRPSFRPSINPSTSPSSQPSTTPPSASLMPSSSPTSSDCSFLEPCEVNKNGAEKFQMCMWEASKNKYKDTCQSIEKLEEYLDKGDGLAKCGECYSLGVNVIPATKAEEDCSAFVQSCGVKNNVVKYPMCMWDVKKGDEPTTKCQSDAQLQKYKKKGQVLVHCGSCDNSNFFEGYFPLPDGSSTNGKTSTKKSKKYEDEDVEIEVKTAPRESVDVSSCDWKVLSACGKEKKGAKKYPVCLWDPKKEEEKSKCTTVSKLEYYMGKGDELLSCEGYC